MKLSSERGLSRHGCHVVASAAHVVESARKGLLVQYQNHEFGELMPQSAVAITLCNQPVPVARHPTIT